MKTVRIGPEGAPDHGSRECRDAPPASRPLRAGCRNPPSRRPWRTDGQWSIPVRPPAALTGQGVALCSLATIRSDLAEGRLVRLSDVSVLDGFDYNLSRSDLTPRDPVRRKARRAFLSWIDGGRAAG